MTTATPATDGPEPDKCVTCHGEGEAGKPLVAKTCACRGSVGLEHVACTRRRTLGVSWGASGNTATGTLKCQTCTKNETMSLELEPSKTVALALVAGAWRGVRDLACGLIGGVANQFEPENLDRLMALSQLVTSLMLLFTVAGRDQPIFPSGGFIIFTVHSVLLVCFPVRLGLPRDDLENGWGLGGLVFYLFFAVIWFGECVITEGNESCPYIPLSPFAPALPLVPTLLLALNTGWTYVRVGYTLAKIRREEAEKD